jgi:hypothetical protein
VAAVRVELMATPANRPMGSGPSGHWAWPSASPCCWSASSSIRP